MNHPEFDAAAAKISAWQAAFQQWGCLLLRRAFDAETLKPFLSRAVKAYQRADQAFAQKTLMPKSEIMYRYGHTRVEDAYPSDNPYLALVQLIQTSPLLAFLQALLGNNLVLLYFNSLFRRQEPLAQNQVQPPLPWHQDAAFLRSHALVINTWVPLVNCGINAPGLEVAYPSPQTLLRPPHLPLTHEPQAGDAYELYALEPPPGSGFWQPEMAVGDVLLFHSFTLHRTWLTPAMTETRLSLEIRLAEARAAQALDTFCIPL